MIFHTQLQGLRVLNTRPLLQAHVLSKAIQEAGGIAIEFPTLEIQSTPQCWLQKLPDLIKVQQAIFISANAVHYFFNALKQHNIPWPHSIPITAIGKASALAIADWQCNAISVPEFADSKHLLQLPALQKIKMQTILLVKGEEGKTEIATTLLQRGANLVSLDVYRRVLPYIAAKTIDSLWHDIQVDIILFTSQQAMQNLFTLVGNNLHAKIRHTPCLVISERLAKAASELGIQTIIISPYDTILSTLEQYKEGLIHDKPQ